MSDRLLVTGADGAVGRQLVRHLLSTTDRPLTLWTRAGDAGSARTRLAGAVRARDLASGRVVLAGGDLRDPEPFGTVDPAQVGSIVHLAAVTSFTVDAPTADAVNREGTVKLLDLARRCRHLDRICLASTVYASGLTPGEVPERLLDRPAGFANEYERSKWEMESLVGAGAPALGVPVAVVRLATVVADDDRGTVGTRNAVHNTLGLLRHGLLSLMPGDPATPVHLVTGTLAVRALAAAVDAGSGGVVNVGHRAEDCLTLGKALDIAVAVFGRDEGFVRRRVRRPRYADLPSFTLLADGAASFGSGILGQALGSLLPFARQLYVAKDLRNDGLRRLLPDYRPGDQAALFAAVCADLLEARSGLRESA